MADYWQDRAAQVQEALTSKNVAQVEKQLVKYYSSAQEKIIGQFEKTYLHLLSTIKEGNKPTPADLYKLDNYWNMQAQLKNELQKLGDKQALLLNKRFVEQYQQIYKAIALESDLAYSTIDTEAAQQMIRQIWCADGKSWSDRIWKNTELLQEKLNDNLIDCVVSGKKPADLKHMLMDAFGVSYNRADSLVRTEMAHIQTQAARQRYVDAGVQEVEIWASKDERRCKVCGELHKKRYLVNESIPIPAHPKCRCCILPVLDTEQEVQTRDSEYKQINKLERKQETEQNKLTLAEDYSTMNLEEYIGIPIEQVLGDNESVRKWYYANVHNIRNLIDNTLSLAEQAKQAYELRNKFKKEARAAMNDRTSAEWLNKNRPILSLEDLIKHKMKKYGMTEQEALADIIRSASTTNPDYDKEFLGGG